MPTVTHLEAIEILDSRGFPTLEVACVLDEALRGKAAIPTAAAAGPRQPAPRHDGEPGRFQGRGVRRAVAEVQGTIRSALVGKRFRSQEALDKALRAITGGPDDGRPGANALLGVSVAFARTCALLRGVPLFRHLADVADVKPEALPRPALALFGRSQAESEDRGPLALATVPLGAVSLDEALAQARAVRTGAERGLLALHGPAAGRGQSGTLAAPFFDTDAVATAATEAIAGTGAEPGRQLGVCLLVGGRLRHDDGWYRIDRERLTPREVVEQLGRLSERFPVAAVEDGLADEDWAHWRALHDRMAGRVRVVAHELTGATPDRIARAGADGAADAVRLDPADLATISDAAEAATAARRARLAVIVGAADAETEDDWLADLAVGLGAAEVHFGGLAGAERTAKYNRLLAIASKNPWPLAPGLAPG
jgi:enolase